MWLTPQQQAEQNQKAREEKITQTRQALSTILAANRNGLDVSNRKKAQSLINTLKSMLPSDQWYILVQTYQSQFPLFNGLMLEQTTQKQAGVNKTPLHINKPAKL